MCLIYNFGLKVLSKSSKGHRAFNAQWAARAWHGKKLSTKL